MCCLNIDDWNMNRYVVDQTIWWYSVAQNDIGFEKGNKKILYSIWYTV